MKKFPTYQKIDTLYNRGDNFGVILGEYRRPEFGYIDKWFVTEKVDGTNIRLCFYRGSESDAMLIGGRSDKAQLPKPLLAALEDLVDRIRWQVYSVMDEYHVEELVIFGEGYGPGIQKGGGLYRDDPGFIAFDMLVDGMWLPKTIFHENCDQWGIDVVPALGREMRTNDIVYMVSNGFESHLSKEPKYAEGVIATTDIPLITNAGKRLIWKLKESDFR